MTPTASSRTVPEPASEPDLAPPGAGLPKPELFVARLIFGWQRARSTRASSAALIVEQRNALLELMREVGDAEASRRVLIRRLPGLEDSSRYWSLHMVLDHLRIVNLAIAHCVAELGAGRVPAEPASTATVKPSLAVGPEVVELFAQSCDAVAAAADGLPDLHTAHRYAHPWFGPLDAAGWHVMAGFHLRLHHRQARRILAQLRA